MRKNTKEHILICSEQIILEKGYNALGLQEILNNADVPKGSFYYYFKSKEDFTMQVIINYIDKKKRRVETILEDETLTPIDCVFSLFEEEGVTLAQQNFKNGELLHNLSIDLANQSEKCMIPIIQFNKWLEKKLKITLKKAQKLEQLPKKSSVKFIAKSIVHNWIGVLHFTRVNKDNKSHKFFMKNLKELLR